jgi:hypothetical protein
MGPTSIHYAITPATPTRCMSAKSHPIVTALFFAAQDEKHGMSRHYRIAVDRARLSNKVKLKSLQAYTACTAKRRFY